MKYITISGIYNFDGDRMYITNEDNTSRIKIDDSFGWYFISQGIEDGDTIKLEGFLNYGGTKQKTKDDRDTKIRNIPFDKSYLSFVFYPKNIEVEKKIEQETPQDSKDDNEDNTNIGCAFLFIVLIAIMIYYIYVRT